LVHIVISYLVILIPGVLWEHAMGGSGSMSSGRSRVHGWFDILLLMY